MPQPIFLPTVGKSLGQGTESRQYNRPYLSNACGAGNPGLTWTRTTTLVANSMEGLQYGAASGLLDELMDRTGFLLDTRWSFIYSLTRGYLFGQLPDCILSAAGSAYCQWVEPEISDGKLKSLLSHTVPVLLLTIRPADQLFRSSIRANNPQNKQKNLNIDTGFAYPNQDALNKLP